MPTSRPMGTTAWCQPMQATANHRGNTLNWRAVCGRTARTVRRRSVSLKLTFLPLPPVAATDD